MSQESTAYERPLPEPTETTQPFWDGLRAHKLVLQRFGPGEEGCRLYALGEDPQEQRPQTTGPAVEAAKERLKGLCAQAG